MIRRAMEKKRSGEGGFTLVELLIVIVILGILAAIVVLAIGGLSDTAEKATCNSGAKTIESAEDAYFASPDLGNGSYAANGAALFNAKLLKTSPDGTYVVSAPTATSYHIAGDANGKCKSMPAIDYP